METATAHEMPMPRKRSKISHLVVLILLEGLCAWRLVDALATGQTDIGRMGLLFERADDPVGFYMNVAFLVFMCVVLLLLIGMQLVTLSAGDEAPEGE